MNVRDLIVLVFPSFLIEMLNLWAWFFRVATFLVLRCFLSIIDEEPKPFFFFFRKLIFEFLHLKYCLKLVWFESCCHLLCLIEKTDLLNCFLFLFLRFPRLFEVDNLLWRRFRLLLILLRCTVFFHFMRDFLPLLLRYFTTINLKID